MKKMLTLTLLVILAVSVGGCDRRSPMTEKKLQSFYELRREFITDKGNWEDNYLFSFFPGNGLLVMNGEMSISNNSTYDWETMLEMKKDFMEKTLLLLDDERLHPTDGWHLDNCDFVNVRVPNEVIIEVYGENEFAYDTIGISIALYSDGRLDITMDYLFHEEIYHAGFEFAISSKHPKRFEDYKKVS